MEPHSGVFQLNMCRDSGPRHSSGKGLMKGTKGSVYYKSFDCTVAVALFFAWKNISKAPSISCYLFFHSGSSCSRVFFFFPPFCLLFLSALFFLARIRQSQYVSVSPADAVKWLCGLWCFTHVGLNARRRREEVRISSLLEC